MRLSPTRFAAALAPAVVMYACEAIESHAKQSPPPDLKTWTLDYLRAGVDVYRQVTIASDGTMVVNDSRGPVEHLEGRVSDGGVDSNYGWIELRIEDASAVPRDFSGKGHLRIDTNTITLRDVWFGTRKAPRRPDICELTFTRKQS